MDWFFLEAMFHENSGSMCRGEECLTNQAGFVSWTDGTEGNGGRSGPFTGGGGGGVATNSGVGSGAEDIWSASERGGFRTWLPDGYSQIFRSYVFGPSGLKDYGSATLRCNI